MFRWYAEFVYLRRFVGSGSVNTLSGFAVIFLLTWLGLSPLLANVAGYTFGLVLGFFIVKKFVFRSDGHLINESFRYFIAFLISFSTNILVLHLALEKMNLHVVASQLLAAVSYTVLMYFLTRFFVFVLPKETN